MSSTNSSPVALVTGASTGIGRAIASVLTESGYRVFGTSREPARASATPYPLLKLDVCDDISVERCIAEVGPIDVLVNNAGYAFVGAVEETSIDEARAQMETNCFGALRMMRAVLPGMRNREGGCIVMVSSVSGLLPPPFLGAYAASKHALEAFSESLSFEVRPHGIRVAIIEFDAMRTGIAFTYPGQLEPTYTGPRDRMIARLERGSRETGEDPLLVARCVQKIISSTEPPLRWIIGDHTARVIEARKKLSQNDFAALVRRELGLWPGKAS